MRIQLHSPEWRGSGMIVVAGLVSLFKGGKGFAMRSRCFEMVGRGARNSGVALFCAIAFCGLSSSRAQGLGQIQVVGPYQPVPFSPRLYYYNPNAYGAGYGYGGGGGYGAGYGYGGGSCDDYIHPTPYELWRDEAILSELRDIKYSSWVRRTAPR